MNLLISALLDKNALTEGNIITATYSIKDIFGRILTKTDEFDIVKVDKTDFQINFTLRHLVEKNEIYINDEHIVAIDGMKIERYADVYDINLDGTSKKIGKKRGRKPKQKKM